MPSVRAQPSVDVSIDAETKKITKSKKKSAKNARGGFSKRSRELHMEHAMYLHQIRKRVVPKVTVSAVGMFAADGLVSHTLNKLVDATVQHARSNKKAMVGTNHVAAATYSVLGDTRVARLAVARAKAAVERMQASYEPEP